MNSDMPEGWTYARLNDVCRKITDGTHHSPPNGPSGPFYYITAKNIRRDGLDLSNVTFVDEATHAAIYARCPAEEGDVLYIKDGATTGIAILNTLAEPFSMLSSVALIKPDSRVLDARYLVHWLNAPETFAMMTGRMTGSAIRRLTLTTISSQHVPLPPLAEQRRIVARIEMLLARTRRARADLGRVAPLAGRYRQSLVDAALAAGQEVGWQDRALGDVAAETRNGIAAKPADEPPGTPMLRISAVRAGRVTMSDRRYHRPTGPGAEHPYHLRSRDLLFVRFNGNPDLVAACGMVRCVDGPCVYPDKLIRMRLDESRAVPEFVEMAAASRMAREQLARHIKTAAGQHGISGSDLKTLRLLMPDTATQRAVADAVAAKRQVAESSDREATRALALLHHLEQAILGKAFRGDLAPQGPNDEPAEVTLARLQQPTNASRKRRIAASTSA